MLEKEVAWEQGYSHELPVKVGELVVRFRKTPLHCLTIVWKRCRDGALPIYWPLLSCIIPTLFAYTFWHAIPTSFYVFIFLQITALRTWCKPNYMHKTLALLWCSRQHFSEVRTTLTISLTWGTDNSKIIKMWTVGNTNPSMPAAQNRGFISNTSHIIQEYWASPLSKASKVDSNGYREMDSLLDTIPKPYWPIAFNKQCIHF